MQLIAGRVAQEYNQRKARKGAYWEDRYHATAIDTDEHLIRCLIYIDLNMARAGVVGHPSEWLASGFNEIQNPPLRYNIIDTDAWLDLLGFTDINRLQQEHNQWLNTIMAADQNKREGRWSESLAVGSQNFVERVKKELGVRAKARGIKNDGGHFTVKETRASYNTDFTLKMGALSDENTYNWA